MPVRKEHTVSAFDVETTGLRPWYGDTIFAYCICNVAGEVKVVRNKKHPVKPLQEYLNDTTIDKICHNLKFELSMLTADGYHIPKNTVWHDTMIMSQLIKNLRPFHSLDYLAWELSGWSREGDFEVKRLGRAYNGYDKIPEHIMHKYQIADGQRTMILFQAFWPEIANTKLEDDYWNEIELIKTTMRMERNGVKLIVPNTNALIKEMNAKIEKAEVDLIDTAGEYYNLGSPKQVGHLLYEKLKLPVIAFTKSGGKSTDKKVLEKLEESNPHTIFDILHRYRAFTKGRGIIEGYKKTVGEDGIIHPNLKTNHAATGREACDNPNLQNVSKRENKSVRYPIPARRCFGPRSGCFYLLVDQAGIEMRLIIEASQCTRMIELMKKGFNPHIIAAETFYGKMFRSKAEDKDLYSTAKNGHFCLAYGGGLDAFAFTLMLTISKARPGFESYKFKFPEIANLISDGIRAVKDNDGFITTAFGRKLQIPHEEIYAWLNYFIQGTAAGIIKRGQIQVEKWLQKHWPEVKLVLTIHDEIIFELPLYLEKFLPEIMHGISETMIHIEGISVPLEVEFKMTKTNWDEAEDISC